MKRLLMILMLAAFALSAGPLGAQVNEFGPAQPYEVQKGDSAASIAKRFYGKASLGSKLWQANRSLVANPQRLTVGDTIYLFPESTLLAGKSTAVPPPPQEKPDELYDRGQPLNIAYPKYFTFLADGRGLGETGVMRIKVKKADPITGEIIGGVFEAREVGSIVASDEHPGLFYRDGADKARYSGKTMLSTNDEVFIRFTEDLAKILDSDTYGDADPYFREFPVYGRSFSQREPDHNRVDRGQTVGELYRYKGKLTVVARIDGLAPIAPNTIKALKKRGNARNQDVEPVTYAARITYTEDVMDLNDLIFVFVPLNPGPERLIEAPYVEPPDSYVSMGD